MTDPERPPPRAPPWAPCDQLAELARILEAEEPPGDDEHEEAPRE